MTRPGGRGLTRSELAATAAVVLLAVVGVLALWPRPPGAASSGDTERAAPAAVSDADLTAARARAGLADCPRPAPGGPPGRGPLSGVSLACLGAPGGTDLGAALAGRVALLNLWGSWCAPCRAEMPVLAEYAARPGAVPVIGVDVRDSPQAGLALLADLGVRLASVSDPDGALRATLGAPPALPVSYLVRADGSVARIDPPVPFRSADEVAAAVARYATSPGGGP